MERPGDNGFTVLLLDGDVSSVAQNVDSLKRSGFRNILVADNPGALAENLRSDISVMVMDINMPRLKGISLLEDIRYSHPHIPVIIVTTNDEVETAVMCMKSGAFDYLIKPVDSSRLTSAIRRAYEINTLRRENISLRNTLLSGQVRDKEAFASIITHSRKMYSVFQYAEAIARSAEPVILTGETGVGKELMARAIHRLSGRAGRFVPVNVAGLDENVFADTLFGHRKGAYTGAQADRQGLVAEAVGGTLFLDEIGDMSHNSQTKLLRLLQEEEYYPLGEDKPARSDIRTIVATNQDLEALVVEGKFRSDLFYRLNTHHIRIPPLRERREDIPLLFTSFLDAACRALGKKKPTVPSELFTLISAYHFPGNVRELQSMVYDAVARHGSRMLSMESFRSSIQRSQLPILSAEIFQEEDKEKFLLDIFGNFPTLKEAERFLVSKALKLADGNQGIAASLLGISRQALNRRLKRSEKNDRSPK